MKNDYGYSIILSVMEEQIRAYFNIEQRQLETYSPLTLAYIGDCVYELVLRTVLATTAEGSTKNYTKKGTELAKAVTQAKMIKALMPEGEEAYLSEEEIAVFKRGRNANTTHGAKNATTGEYRLATGFEALVGWLYLQGEMDRVLEIIETAWNRISINPAK